MKTKTIQLKKNHLAVLDWAKRNRGSGRAVSLYEERSLGTGYSWTLRVRADFIRPSGYPGSESHMVLSVLIPEDPAKEPEARARFDRLVALAKEAFAATA